ncbi:hypothetical protein, partial [Pseudomonas sp. GW456-11-11-14-TSB2]|uniref:hypothetical protein n=1 Tax=Pseudomonas sp. GW456-11-11-14-TSB2 TaxID=2751348 RepID=UPI002115B525
MSSAAATSGKRFLDRINDLLGIVRNEYDLAPVEPSAPTVDEAWVQAKIDERIEAKKAKNFALADAIRAELEA